MSDLTLEKTFKMVTIGKPKTEEALRHVKLFDNVLSHEDVGGSGHFDDSAPADPQKPSFTYKETKLGRNQRARDRSQNTSKQSSTTQIQRSKQNIHDDSF